MFDWVETEFRTVDLGDIRRNQRLQLVASRMWEKPEGSQRAAAKTESEAMGSYRLWYAAAVNDAAILSAHREQVLQRARGRRMLLHIQDTTELDYTSHKTVKGLGPLSDPSRRGLFAHGEYLLQEDGLPLGLWDCRMWVRSDQEHGKSKDRHEKPIEQKESYRWLEGTRHACQLQGLFPKTLVISLSDRESDIYESFQEFARRRQGGKPAAHWIIRCKHDREISPPEPDQAQVLRIKGALAAAPLLGRSRLQVQSKEELKKVKGKRQRTVRQARIAELEMRACFVQLRPPQHAPGLQPLGIWVVEAKEVKTPEGQDPIHWILLTDFQVRTFKKALQILQLYNRRWTIEVFHKVLKSGCQAEEHPPEDIDRLRPYLALQMVIAWRIHYVTLLGRECPNLPADVLFEEWEWKPVVVVFCGKHAPLNVPTLAQMIFWIANLGGHKDRKGDGEPGPKTIWKGMAKMFAYGDLWRALHDSS